MSTVDYAARVKRGAELLDRERPGWAREIDVHRLEVNSHCNCVLGQVYGTFLSGCFALGTHEEAENGFLVTFRSPDFGFSLWGSETANGRMAAYAELDRLWIAEIRARLMPAPAIDPPVPVGAGVLELQLV